jgi:hypothetical protein
MRQQQQHASRAAPPVHREFLRTVSLLSDLRKPTRASDARLQSNPSSSLKSGAGEKGRQVGGIQGLMWEVFECVCVRESKYECVRVCVCVCVLLCSCVC